MGHDVIFSDRETRVVNRDGDVRLVADYKVDLYYIREMHQGRDCNGVF